MSRSYPILNNYLGVFVSTIWLRNWKLQRFRGISQHWTAHCGRTSRMISPIHFRMVLSEGSRQYFLQENFCHHFLFFDRSQDVRSFQKPEGIAGTLDDNRDRHGFQLFLFFPRAFPAKPGDRSANRPVYSPSMPLINFLAYLGLQ